MNDSKEIKALALVGRILDPKDLGHVAAPEIRDAARMVLSREPVAMRRYVGCVPPPPPPAQLVLEDVRPGPPPSNNILRFWDALLVSFFVIAIVVLSGCYGQAEQSQQVNSEYKVEKLFSVEGCTVYRFWDSTYRYFTSCKGSTQWTESCGKNCSRDMSVGGQQ